MLLSSAPPIQQTFSALAATPPATPYFGQAPLSPEAVETLLQRLVKEGWGRLSSEYDDPLGMLFSNRVRQWTAGWHGQALYLLVWESESWQQKAQWLLYKNGELVFKETDGASRTRSALLQKLLESDALPFITQNQFLNPICDFRQTQFQRIGAGRALLSTILARPEIFEHLKDSLFRILEAHLGTHTDATLEVIRLNRLSQKNIMVHLFRRFVESGLIRAVRDNARLDRALSLLQEDYVQFGYRVADAFRAPYDHAYEEFRKQITAGTWRVRLRLKIPEPA